MPKVPMLTINIIVHFRTTALEAKVSKADSSIIVRLRNNTRTVVARPVVLGLLQEIQKQCAYRDVEALRKFLLPLTSVMSIGSLVVLNAAQGPQYLVDRPHFEAELPVASAGHNAQKVHVGRVLVGRWLRRLGDWAYAGADGDWWSKTVEWTNQWIKDHADAGARAGKPVVHREYGWLTPETRLEDLYKTAAANETRVAVLGGWQAIMKQARMPDMFWQFGFSNFSYGRNNDDGFTIHLDDAEAKLLVYEHAARVNAA